MPRDHDLRSVPVNILVYDPETGKAGVLPHINAQSWDETEYWYTEGNYSCDCNRRLMLYRDCLGDEAFGEQEEDLPCGDTLRIVAFEEGKVVYSELAEEGSPKNWYRTTGQMGRVVVEKLD